MRVKTTVVPRHKLIVMLFVLVLLWGCGQSNQQQQNSDYDLSSAQATIKSLFKAVQENDSSAFMSMLATKDDFVSYYEAENALPDGTKRSPEEIEKEAGAENILLPWLRAEVRKRFVRIYQQGLADGIPDWKKATVYRATADYQNELNQSSARVLFEYEGNIGGIQFGYLIKAKRGWVLGYAVSGHIGSHSPIYDKMIPSRFIK